jgi:hypothetical protein
VPLRAGAYATAAAAVVAFALGGMQDLALPALALVAGWSAAWSP